MPLTQFDGIVYINLNRRTDRKEALLSELKHLRVDPSKIHRIEAVDDPLNGVKGCLHSHLKALDFVESQGWKRGLILEDDAIFLFPVEKIEGETELFFRDFEGLWDVYLLGGRYKCAYHTFRDEIYRIYDSIRAHAYCVHPDYFSKLRACFYEGVKIMENHLFYSQSLSYGLDVLWRKLQQKDRWFAPRDPLINQSEGMSDIELRPKAFRY